MRVFASFAFRSRRARLADTIRRRPTNIGVPSPGVDSAASYPPVLEADARAETLRSAKEADRYSTILRNKTVVWAFDRRVGPREIAGSGCLPAGPPQKIGTLEIQDRSRQTCWGETGELYRVSRLLRRTGMEFERHAAEGQSSFHAGHPHPAETQTR